jgi:hypothetical protein
MMSSMLETVSEHKARLTDVTFWATVGEKPSHGERGQAGIAVLAGVRIKREGLALQNADDDASALSAIGRRNLLPDWIGRESDEAVECRVDGMHLIVSDRHVLQKWQRGDHGGMSQLFAVF